MAQAAVGVAELNKTFLVPEREAGLRAAAKSLFRRQHREVRAVDDIAFEVGQGEGRRLPRPNGPSRRRPEDARAPLPPPGERACSAMSPPSGNASSCAGSTLVMGNPQPAPMGLPALDSYELNRAIYRIPRDEFTTLRDELIELLDVGDLVRKPVRNLRWANG